jgi:hypothetical protein
MAGFLVNWPRVPPCWRAYFLLLRQKKVAKEKATPRAAPALPVSCATRNAGRLRNSGLRPSDSPRRRPPAFLRCSAPSTGTPKASGLDRCSAKNGFRGQPEKTAKNEIHRSGTQAQTRLVSPGPLRGAEQRRGWRIKGEDCLRAKPEFHSPRQLRVAQGTGAAGTDPGSPSSLATFFLAKQEESTPAPQARKTRVTKGH